MRALIRSREFWDGNRSSLLTSGYRILRSLGQGSAGRAAFVARSGKMMVPYLVDPNRDVAMFESADIIAYLNRTYAET